ncbi:unnamed protein product [Meloidogyne enterolobii]|uniref:Uncharacterized protein n=1 Tax=Meloidogyne enterolobii TaxID=390850 RepID=A0ACB1A806_MELEN
MRKLEFDAVCTSGNQRNGQNLFKISQIQNSRLHQKLISEAKNTEYDGYGSVEDKWNNKNNEWSEERQWGDEENERDIEEDNDGFNGRNGKNVDDDFRRRNRPSRDIDLKIKAERGDILEARVDAIINPTRPSLSVGRLNKLNLLSYQKISFSSEPLNGDEAIPKVLRAKSLFDVVDVKDKDSLDKKRLLRALTKLANMVEPANNLRQKERATHAKRKIQQWQQMVNDDQKWGELLEEAENLPMDGYNRGLESSVSERIVRNAGPVLAKKLEQIAKEKGGLPVGDAFATESFQIGRYYFAKSN